MFWGEERAMNSWVNFRTEEVRIALPVIEMYYKVKVIKNRLVVVQD